MSITLGEKLRQAREERGITLSEVAEQTRISSLYLESIEHDDYRNLPGGIFNKGFVKTFAKYVGVDEQEALADYARLIVGTDVAQEAELKLYRPQVLTDDRSLSAMVPTIIGAVVVLAIMTAGILFLVNYLRQPAAAPTANLGAANTSTPANANTAQTTTAPSDAPSMGTLKVEFKATTEPVSLSATNDGKLSSNVVPAGSSATFEPKDSLKLSYSRSLAQVVQLTINGKNIALPSRPLDPKRNAIEFEINKDNLVQIWQAGSITTDVPPANPDTNPNTAANPGTPALMGTPLPAGTPVKQAANAVPKPTGAANAATNTAAKPPTNTKPTNTSKPPPAMTAKPKPTP